MSSPHCCLAAIRSNSFDASDTAKKAIAYKKAIAKYREAARLLQTAGDRRKQAEVLSAIAGVYGDLGDKARGLKYFQQALALQRAARDSAGEAKTINDIGSICLDARFSDPQQALKFFNQALDMQRALGDWREEVKTLFYIGEAQTKLKQPELALETYEKALVISRAIQDKVFESVALKGITISKNAKTN